MDRVFDKACGEKYGQRVGSVYNGIRVGRRVILDDINSSGSGRPGCGKRPRCKLSGRSPGLVSRRCTYLDLVESPADHQTSPEVLWWIISFLQALMPTSSKPVLDILLQSSDIPDLPFKYYRHMVMMSGVESVGRLGIAVGGGLVKDGRVQVSVMAAARSDRGRCTGSIGDG